jgi:DNA adenine methylase
MKFPKPIVKWVGGKTQIIDKVLSHFPTKMVNYHEIFVGGGSVLFALLHSIHQNNIQIEKHIYAYDLNENLIYMYKNIQQHYQELFHKIQEIVEIYRTLPDVKRHKTQKIAKPTTLEEAKQSKEQFYYWIRQQYNELSDKQSILNSAMFIFLNKTCFRGVYRIGPNGFNVPYGNYKDPEIINYQHLQEIHILIQNVIFECCDYKLSLQRIQSDDFVYMDPPYAETNFVSYTLNGFNREEHITLFNVVHNLSCNWMMSNADVPLVREYFSEYTIRNILCKRSIHSKQPDAKAMEVIIQNY